MEAKRFWDNEGVIRLNEPDCPIDRAEEIMKCCCECGKELYDTEDDYCDRCWNDIWGT